MQPQTIPASLPDRDKIAQIAAALRSRYGADALRVAERQHEDADGDNRVTWQAVIDRLAI